MPARQSARSAALFDALVDLSDDAIYATDLDSIVASWNHAAECLFGFESGNAVGRSITSLFGPEHAVEESALLSLIRRGDSSRDIETVRRRADGTRVAVAISVAPVRDTRGAVVATIRIARDIGGRAGGERAARRLAAIVESSDDAIVSKDLVGIVTSWNQAAERMFGYSAADMIGESIRKLIPPDRQSEEDDVLARLRRGEKVDHFETIRIRRDGSSVPISLTVSPILDASGRVVGASKIARDISDRRRAEAERERLLTIAEENAAVAARLNRLKDEFLATLSHELRTPLNAILGYARMIRGGIVTPENRARAIAAVERNAVSLAQIVEDILDVSRIVSGKLRLNVEPIDLADVVSHAIEAVKPAADAKAIDLETRLDRHAGRVSGDAERLQQVAWNILSNAVKFTPRGGRVDVRLARRTDSVELEVRDTGIGITPEFLPHLFERFRQQDAGTTRERGGLGLGLGIARQLIEMHGGTIEAASDGPGTGATFRVVLPRLAAADGQARQPDSSFASASIMQLRPLHGVRVLVVDDDADALAMVREILEAAGARVAVASSAGAAMDVVGAVRPDVLVADLGMPIVDGFELIAQVRRDPDAAVRNVPAAAITAYARSEDRAKALQSGFQVHLAKPIDPVQLTEVIADLASRPAD